MKPQPYNGHHCWTCWNVALWIGNHEPLYLAAMESIKAPRANGKPVTASLATRRFMRITGLGSGSRTPDGARYSHVAVKNAMAGLMED